MKHACVISVVLATLAVMITVLNYLMPSGAQATRHALLSLERRVSSLSETQAMSNAELQRLVSAVKHLATALAGIKQSPQDDTNSPAPITAAVSQEDEEEVPDGPPRFDLDFVEDAVQMHFLTLSQKKLKDILEDSAINPQKKVPDKVTKARIDLELTRAQARLSVLHSEITLELIQGLNLLRDGGHFIEYPSDGSPPAPNDKSVLSVAEQLPSGVCRMYWLDRASFPEVHNMRNERRAVATQAVNRIAGLISGSE